MMPEIPGEFWMTLSDVRFDFADSYDCSQPLTGRCTYAFDTTQMKPLGEHARRIEYFRPDLPGAVRGTSYFPGPLIPPQGEVSFRFVPIFPEITRASSGGSLALFLQLYSAENWVSQQGCQRISNAAAVIIELR